MITLLLPTLVHGADVELTKLATDSGAAATTYIKFVGRLSSEAPVGHQFIKTQNIFNAYGIPFALRFTFTHLKDEKADNQWAVSIKGCDESIVKRIDANGLPIDEKTPMTIMFDSEGFISLFDCGHDTEGRNPPQLYVEWPAICSPKYYPPLLITWALGQNESKTFVSEYEYDTNQLRVMNGPSLITYSQQNGKSCSNSYRQWFDEQEYREGIQNRRTE
jgi:hypothetical protein